MSRAPALTFARRVDELVAGIHLASDSAHRRGDADLSNGLLLLARSGEELQAACELDTCSCPGQAHAIGCPELEGAREAVVASLEDQGVGALATLVALVLSPAPLTESATKALEAVHVAFGGAR